MRSREEWQEYVESQIQAAKERRERLAQGETATATDPVTARATAPPPTEDSATSEQSTASSEGGENRQPPANPRLSEGRSLLSWNDTMPMVAEPSDPSSMPPLGLSPDQASDPRGAGEASDASAETNREPLKPYQPSDPRWRSSVMPPRLRVIPLADRRAGSLAEASSPTSATDVPQASPAPESQEASPAPESAASVQSPLPSEAPPSSEREVAASPEAPQPSSSHAEPQPAPTDPAKATETAAPTKRARRLTSKKVETAPTAHAPVDLQALWDRVPSHVQALIRTQSDEVAQRSYSKNFRETREDLIRRLLDPELTLEEAARILGVCPTTVRRYTNRDLLPHHRTPGNQRRFRLSHVLEFMEKFGVALQEEREEATNGEVASGPFDVNDLFSSDARPAPAEVLQRASAPPRDGSPATVLAPV